MSQRFRLAIIGPIVGCIFISATASANSYTVETVKDLLDFCRVHEQLIAEKDDTPIGKIMSAFACRHFVQGFLAGHNTVLAWANAKSSVAGMVIEDLPIYCVPPNATVGSAIASFLIWADSHPESWQSLAGIGVGWALEATWPCAKSI